MTEGAQSADWVPALLQVSDPLFPTGAYAHSMGLEQWADACGYQSGEDLSEFFREHAGPSLARLELPYLRYALAMPQRPDTATQSAPCRFSSRLPRSPW